MSRHPILALLAAFGTYAAGPALAQTTTVPVPAPAPEQPMVDPLRLELGIELGRLMNSEELTRGQLVAMFDESLPKMFAGNADIQALEDKYPGFIKAALDAMQPILVRQTMKGLPELWHRLGRVYGSSMSEAELRGAIAFFGSLTGVKLVAALTAGMDFDKMLAGMGENGDVTEKALIAGIQSGAQAAMTKMTAAEIQQFLAFSRTPGGRKMMAAAAQARATTVEWANQSSPEDEAELDRAMADVIERFVGKEPQGNFKHHGN
jgi:hypothetical protein